MTDAAGAFQRAQELHEQGLLGDALRAYEDLLRSWPGHADALHYAGLALYQLGRPDAAVTRIEQALSARPTDAQAWSNLALVRVAVGRHAIALEAAQQAVRHDPRSAEIWNNLASVWLANGRPAEAELAARQSIKIAATFAQAWFNLALALEALERPYEALAAAARAVELAPGQTPPAGLKAQLEQDLGRGADAGKTLDSALARDPGSTALQFQRATLSEQQGDLAVAAHAYERVSQLEPSHGPALSELVFLRKRLADWHDLAELQRRFAAGVAAGMPQLSPFSFLSDPSSRSEQRGCAEGWSALLPTAPAAPQRTLSAPRLRIGYLSSDFHQHATTVLAAGLFEQHDRERFEIAAYSTGPDDGTPMRARLVAAFDRFVDVRGWTSARIAERIRTDGIDLLVDLKGHTQHAPTAVCALRPAPIQISYLGYPGTMGAAFIDYLIGDAIVTPLAHAADYTEALVQLPGSYQINDRARVIAEPPPRAALGLPPNATVLCSFNSTFKLNPAVFDAWAQILKAVPESVLWLLTRSAEPEHDPVVGNLRREVSARGIDPRRVVFAAARPNPEYLGLYRHADLFLDTWPYNAHTTASDALWAGCPVLTWLGETFAGRVAASLLTAAGLPELIASDARSYTERAIALAREPEALVRYRLHLSGPGRGSTLFDTAATTRALEAAYLGMAAQYARGVRQSFRGDGGPLR
jgi:predicted O-linked N-acetylglucosamine transferase (SPINDLY family)